MIKRRLKFICEPSVFLVAALLVIIQLENFEKEMGAEQIKQGNRVDIFSKCDDYKLAEEYKAKGYYPYFHPLDENEGPVVSIEGKSMIMAGSNNYLGLTDDPRVKEAAINAVKKFGTSCSGSRYLTGTLSLHVELEEKLCDFFQKEAALIFSTGYLTGQGVIPTLVHRNEYLIMDRDNHACLVVAAAVARSGLAKVERFRHNDMNHLEILLKNSGEESPKLIVTDGVFSVSGVICKLPEIVSLAKKYNARVLIDDAHAVGVIGKYGKGTASEFGLENDVDMTMGTFSKSFASLGGFVVGEKRVIEYIKHNSPALIFSASPTASSIAAAIAALDIMKKEPERVTQLIKNAEFVRTNLRRLGFNLMDSRTAIVSVLIGDQEKTVIFWRRLFDNGIYVNAFIRPGVMPGQEMLRTSYMSSHKQSHLEKIVEQFARIGKELGVIQ